MRNNTRGLIFHIFISIIIFALAFLVNFNSTVRNIMYGNIIFKIIVIAVVLILYYNFGKFLSKRSAKALDFFAGNLIVLIGLILFGIGFIGLGMNIFESPVGGSFWKFPMELFLMPQVYSIKVLGIKYNAITLLIATIIPGIIYGISIKISRSKLIKREIALRNRNMRKRLNNRRR